jgi:hypothetical protein
MRCTWLALGFVVAAAGSCVQAQLRQSVDLGGEWEFVKVADLATGPPTDGWAKKTVPGVLNGFTYERAWFRRDFTIPATMQGSRIVIHFGGVKWNSVVRVNGREVGGHYGGYEPFDVDITDVAKVGATNRLELGCHDWTGVFSDRETDFSIVKQRPTDPRYIPRDKILSPVGGRTSDYGPWDRVTLQSHPAIYVKDVFVKTSVRQKKLTVDYILANGTAADVTVTLAAGADEGFHGGPMLPPKEVTIPAGGEAREMLELAWMSRPAYQWSPENPFLYDLVTTLQQGKKLLDSLRTPFGFREFWVEGSHFVLNGSRINLLATSWWPEIGVTREYVKQRLQTIKRANCVAFRTHTQPWPEVWYEVADEVGLMMIPEGPVWNDRDAYRINDPKFWENYATALKAMVDRDKNKPSVIMYSLENEFYGGRLKQGTPAAQELARMGRLMKQWDPTRPIYYESDGDPGGVADAVGLHYPHEYPEFADWPNTAYWMDQPLLNKFFAPTDEAAKSWVWDRKKPVYIGEFLWIPSSDPSWDTVFYGDEAYLDYRRFHIQAKADSWRMAIQAYRYYEVGGISPWTMVEGGPLDDTNAMYVAQQYAMQHLAAYVREYDHNFISGETVKRTADVYNDILAPSRLTVQWALADEGSRSVTAPTATNLDAKPAAEHAVGAVTDRDLGEATLDMQPGERKKITFTVALPQVTQRREVALRVRVVREGRVVFEDTKPWSVFPPLKLQATAPVGLYDPRGEFGARLGQAGLKVEAVSDLGRVPPGVRVLIVGPGALEEASSKPRRIGEQRAGSGRLLDYVRGGGRVLVLEQRSVPPGVMPVALSERNSTMTFAQAPEHPLLPGLRPTDLKWWRPDNVVSVSEIARPLQGGLRAIVVSGSRTGLSHAPLMEVFLGRGVLVLSQLRLAERLGVEPTAGVILQNAVDYLAGFQPATVRTALYCPDEQTRDVLGELGLQSTDVTAAPAQADWSAVSLLIACHPVAGLEPCLPQLQALLRRGGTILLHGLEPAELASLRSLLPTEVKLATYHGAATRLPQAGTLTDFFANEDLYWLGRATAAHSWATRPRATDMTSAIVLRSLDEKAATTYDHTVMAITGAHAADRPDGAILPSGGSTATAQVDIPKDGAYMLGVVAGGSIAAGEWPAGSVLMDGRTVGEFACQRGEPDTYALPADLKAGKHEVAIRFTNDLYDEANRQDRNLLVKALLVAPDNRAAEVTFLTSPPALAVVRAGPTASTGTGRRPTRTRRRGTSRACSQGWVRPSSRRGRAPCWT